MLDYDLNDFIDVETGFEVYGITWFHIPTGTWQREFEFGEPVGGWKLVRFEDDKL